MNVTVPDIWLIRCGEGGTAVEACVSNDVVAVRFATVGDVSALRFEEVIDQMGVMSNPSGHRRLAAELLAFANEIRTGDWVVTPDKARRRYFLGTITGSYEWDENSPIPEMHHLRTVDWSSYLDWDTVPLEFKSIKYYQRAVLRTENAVLIEACSEAMNNRISKDDLLVTTTKTALSKLRTRKTPVVKPAKSTTVSQERLCATCGLKKHLGQFSDASDLCVDCE